MGWQIRKMLDVRLILLIFPLRDGLFFLVRYRWPNFTCLALLTRFFRTAVSRREPLDPVWWGQVRWNLRVHVQMHVMLLLRVRLRKPAESVFALRCKTLEIQGHSRLRPRNVKSVRIPSRNRQTSVLCAGSFNALCVHRVYQGLHRLTPERWLCGQCQLDQRGLVADV